MVSSLETRVPPPIVTAIVALAMWAASLSSAQFDMNAYLRAGLVLVFFLLAAICGFPAIRAFVGAKTTIDPVHVERASVLVRSGIYRLTRNPMYVAMTLLLSSWAAFLATPLSLLGPLCFVLFITRFQILPEERVLTAKFGAEYLDYKRKVRRWV